MNQSRIMITGTHSGCGKTTITCALIKALKEKGNNVVSYKTGPDYVDPMFHNVILNSDCRNLDMFFCDDKTINHLINKNSTEDSVAIIEGVMGFYDGLGGTSTKASSYDLARITKTPTILVVNGKGASVSIIALIKGFLEYKENNIAGIIINNISAMFYQTIKPLIEKECGVELLGYLEYDQKLSLEHRHLGLLMPNEIEDIEEKMKLLALKVSESINLDRVQEIANSAQVLAEDFNYDNYYSDITIGVAKDDVFCFYYKDNIELLEKHGAIIKYFSVLNDSKIPNGIDGLIIGGGYPELFAQELADNKSMIKSIKDAVNRNMPIFAEGGGFVYLGTSLDVDNEIYSLCDIIQMKSELTSKLQPFGYITNQSAHDNIILKQGDSIPSHEFHYIKTDLVYDAFTAKKPLSNRQWKTGYSTNNIVAGFSHYHFYANLDLAINFIKACTLYQKKRGIQ